MTVILVAKASAGETPFHNENGYPESPLSQVKGDAHPQFIGKMGTQAPYLGGPPFCLDIGYRVHSVGRTATTLKMYSCRSTWSSDKTCSVT